MKILMFVFFVNLSFVESVYIYKGICNDFFPMVMYICLQLVCLMKFLVESFKSIEYIHWLHLETLYSTQQ